MICPQLKDSKATYGCNALYCPPSSDANKPGNFSVSVCTYSMVKPDDSSSQNLKIGAAICEYTPQMCDYSCDYLLKNVSSLPSTFPEKSTIGEVKAPYVQIKMAVGCVPGNFTLKNEFSYMSEVHNPPSSSAGNQLAVPLLLPMLLALVLLLKIKSI